MTDRAKKTFHENLRKLEECYSEKELPASWKDGLLWKLEKTNLDISAMKSRIRYYFFLGIFLTASFYLCREVGLFQHDLFNFTSLLFLIISGLFAVIEVIYSSNVFLKRNNRILILSKGRDLFLEWVDVFLPTDCYLIYRKNDALVFLLNPEKMVYQSGGEEVRANQICRFRGVLEDFFLLDPQSSFNRYSDLRLCFPWLERCEIALVSSLDIRSVRIRSEGLGKEVLWDAAVKKA